MDAAEVRSATVSFESAAVEEKSGPFGGLGFLIRFPIVEALEWPPAHCSAAPLWRDALVAAERLIDPAYSPAADAPAYDLQARPKSVRQAADGLIPEGRLAVPTVLLQGSGVRALPPHSRAAVQRASA